MMLYVNDRILHRKLNAVIRTGIKTSSIFIFQNLVASPGVKATALRARLASGASYVS